MFIPDQNVGYLVIIVLPIIIYYFFKFRGRAFVIYVVLSLSFTAGSIELLTGFAVHRLLQICELLIWALTFYIFLITPKRHIPNWPYLVGFVFICLVSYFINPVNFIQLLLFLRKYLLFIVLFILFYNIKLSDKDRENLLKFIILLFLTQIIVNIVKFPFIGRTEPYIGTMSILGGSTTAIFSLVGISFAFSAYLYTRSIKYILLLFGFFIFSIIGAKRGHMFFVPFLLVAQYILYVRMLNVGIFRNLLMRTPVILIMVALIIYIGIVFTPSLNPEGVIGGSFDPSYTIEYIDTYLNPGRTVQGVKYFGRGEAPLAVYRLLSNSGLLASLIGLGPGDIIMSRYTIPYEAGFPEEMIAGMKYNIGYGSRTGLLFTAMQIGILGALFYFFFVFKVFSSFFNKRCYSNDVPVKKQIIALGLSGFLGIFVFDYFAYSQTSFNIIPIILPVCFAYNYVKNGIHPNREYK
ncbi:MAG TPA: hypothetical protein PKW17_12355 [Smithellaceae bacterium]|nr:hypothetical protein [Smithellaceae bacterium]